MFKLSNFEDVSIACGHNTNGGTNVDFYLYAVDGLLFDCGPQVMAEDVKAFIASNDIKQVAITHVHEDHCGMASWIAENLSVPIYVPPEDVAAARADGIYPDYRHNIWGDRPAFPALPLPETLQTEKYTFRHFHTPGHVAYHRVFLEESRGWLFSGDLYVRSRYRYIDIEENIFQLMDSLERVLALDFETVFCPHAGVLTDGRSRLQKKLDFLRSIQDKVLDYKTQGLSSRQITDEMFPEDVMLAPLTCGEWTAFNLVDSFLKAANE